MIARTLLAKSVPIVMILVMSAASARAITSGTSCRHQVEHVAPVRARHMAELLADALA